MLTGPCLSGVGLALESAAAVITLNPLDAECLPSPEKIRRLRPFLETNAYGKAAGLTMACAETIELGAGAYEHRELRVNEGHDSRAFDPSNPEYDF